MNGNQIESLARTLFKIFGTFLAVHGYQKLGNFLNAEDVTGAIITAIGVIWSYFFHADASNGSGNSKIPGVGAMLALFSLAGLLYAGPCHAQNVGVPSSPVTVQAVAVEAVADAGSVTNVPNFLAQVTAWGSSFNTNYSWTPITLQIEDGYKQASGSGASDYLRVQYDMGKWNIGVEGEFLGIGSQFTAGEIEGGYTLFSKYDFKIEANLLAGYDRGVKAFEIEPELKFTKLIMQNTYMTAGYSLPWFSKGAFNASGQFRVGAGFTF